MSDQNTSLPIRTQSNGDVAAFLVDGTTPSQKLKIDASGNITAKLDDGSGNSVSSQANGSQRALDVGVNVAGVQVDPRDIRVLTSSDVVTSAQGAPNTIGNAWPVKPTDGTNSQGFTALSEAKVITTNDSVIKSQLQDNAGTAITLGQKVMASSLPVTLASDQSPIPVTLQNAFNGTQVNKYNTSSAVAANAIVNHDYAITASKTFYGHKFWASSSGKIRADVQTSPDGVTFTTFWTGFNSTANPNISEDLSNMSISNTGTGSKMRIAITNMDLLACDVYSTISGNEQ